MNIGYATEWNGMIVSRIMILNEMKWVHKCMCIVFVAWKGATGAPVLAGGMNAAGSQWHKSTFCRPDRDGLHPPSLFSNEKKRVGPMKNAKVLVVCILEDFVLFSILQYSPLPILERAGVSLESLAAPL